MNDLKGILCNGNANEKNVLTVCLCFSLFY